ncbi:Na+/H+ antiporter NhaC family protein [Salinicoccus sp. HZC-1]|uniref:Na+/H+ antiporter NhaC family protein n=1 Tax=Salinicoccus sp. HZC-1 TaxID=3385497 RepID=UPI00398B539F
MNNRLRKRAGKSGHFGILSLLPSIIALTLAIVTKRVVLSLLSGILIGTIIIDANANGFIHSIIYSIVNLFATLAGTPANEEAGVYGMGIVKDASRAELIIIVLLLGAFIGVLNKSGGAYAFGHWLADKVKTKEGAQASASVMGISLFTSAYFSSLATGAVFRPVFDKMKISREKLAFFLDSTSAPINTIVPISGWVAFMGALMVDNIESVEDPIQGLIRTIPYNFYNIVMIIIVFLFAFGILKDFGPMKKAEERAKKGKYTYDSQPGNAKS